MTHSFPTRLSYDLCELLIGGAELLGADPTLSDARSNTNHTGATCRQRSGDSHPCSGDLLCRLHDFGDITDITGSDEVKFAFCVVLGDRKSTRLNSRHSCASRMPSSA